MAQLIDIQRVEVGLENLTARVRLSDDAPLMTSEDLHGTTRVYNLMPHIIEHACLGDAGKTFKAAMGNTELAHLLEHVTVELLAQTNLAGDVTSGRTYPIDGDERLYDVQISCADDVLTAGALSSACWIMGWAFSGGGDPAPDVEAIVRGLCGLVDSLGDEPGKRYEHEVEGRVAAEVEDERRRLLAEREAEIASAREVAYAAAERAARERAAAHAAERAARVAAEEERRQEADRRAAARLEAERVLAQREEELRRLEAERQRLESERLEAERQLAEVYAAAECDEGRTTDGMAATDVAPGAAGASAEDPHQAPRAQEDEPIPDFLVDATAGTVDPESPSEPELPADPAPQAEPDAYAAPWEDVSSTDDRRHDDMPPTQGVR